MIEYSESESDSDLEKSELKMIDPQILLQESTDESVIDEPTSESVTDDQ